MSSKKTPPSPPPNETRARVRRIVPNQTQVCEFRFRNVSSYYSMMDAVCFRISFRCSSVITSNVELIWYSICVHKICKDGEELTFFDDLHHFQPANMLPWYPFCVRNGENIVFRLL